MESLGFVLIFTYSENHESETAWVMATAKVTCHTVRHLVCSTSNTYTIHIILVCHVCEPIRRGHTTTTCISTSINTSINISINTCINTSINININTSITSSSSSSISIGVEVLYTVRGVN